MAALDLTTLASVIAYMSPNNQPTATLPISRMITSVSQAILNWMNRDTILARSYTEIRDGRGGNEIMLKRWPVLSIASLVVNNQAIQPGPVNAANPSVSGPGLGYYFEAWDGMPPGNPVLLRANVAIFCRGVANISVAYSAGYGVVGEAAIVASERVTPLSPQGYVAADNGVTYANGTPLVAVASAPAVGQYVAPAPFNSGTPTSYYQFNAGDDNAAVLISYSYVPFTLEGVAAQMVAERLSYSGRIGLKSKVLGGQETITYDISDLPAWVKSMLNNYKSVVPIY